MDSGSANQSSTASDDISVLSKPSDTVFYIGAKTFVAAVVRSERNLPLSYEWFKDGAKLTGQSSNVLEINNVIAADQGQYQLKVHNAIDSVTLDIKVTVSASPVPQISAQPNPLILMVGQSGRLQVEATSSDPLVPLKYQWLKNGVAILGAVAKELNKSSWSIADSGLYSVRVTNSLGVETTIKSNEIGVSVGFEALNPGCATYSVPEGISKLRVIAVGGGGGGGFSHSFLAYNLLSGAGGAAVEAIVTLPANTSSAAYCTGAAGSADVSGSPSTFMTVITANGGDKGNGWHYKNEDGRGTPPSLGGTYTVNTAVAQIVRAMNGQNVTAFGACGGSAGFSIDATRSGLGACSSAQTGINFGGGGWGNGSYYSEGSPTAGAQGYILIRPTF